VLAAMRSTVDEEELAGLVAEAEAILADQVVIIPLLARISAGAGWADRISGYVHNPSAATDTWNIEWWYRR
jgi:ABC-type transport system substrate-binding protein